MFSKSFSSTRLQFRYAFLLFSLFTYLFISLWWQSPSLPLPPLLATRGCIGPFQDLLLDPATESLPPSSTHAPLLIILAVHLYRAAHASAVLRTWAQPRCLRLLRSPSDSTPAGWLLLQPFTFDASPQMDALRATLPPRYHAALPHHFSATMRTEEVLRRVRALHPAALWIFKGDDDTCVHATRLARALLARNASVPALVGHVAPLLWGAYRFVSGGAGYALSAGALSALVPRLSQCNSEASGFRHSTAEDVMVTKCARDLFGDWVMEDHVGFNWGRPEEMLALGVYDASHIRADAITHHYVDPQRVSVLLTPRHPRLVLQVWPFESPPPSADMWLEGLLPWEWATSLLGRKDHLQSSACSAPPSAALLRSIKTCRQMAADAGFEYLLLPASLADNLGPQQLLPILLPEALEQLALLRELYLRGGVAIPLAASCEGLGGGQLEALIRVAEIEQGQGGSSSNGGAGLNDLDAPRRGLAMSLSLAPGMSPRAWAAPQYHHGVFRLLAAQSVNISAPLQEAREAVGRLLHSCNAAEAAARFHRSEILLQGGALAPMRLASAYRVPFARAPLVVAVYSLWLGASIVLDELWLLGDVSRLAFGCGLSVVDENLPIERQLAVADIILVGPYAPRAETSHALAAVRGGAAPPLVVFIGPENTDGGGYDDQMVGEVDVSFGHRRAEDVPEASRATYHRLPWWLPYTVRKESGGCALPASLFTPTDAAAWAARGGFAALLSSHYSYPRPQLFNWTSALGRVDAPGKAFHNMEWPQGLPNHHLRGKVEFLSDYRFNLCPENSRTRGAGGYNTEKLAQAHLAGAVPVYWGDPIDTEVWNPARVIFFDGGNEAEVLALMRELQENATFRAAWFAQPVLAPTATSWVEGWCALAAQKWRAAAAGGQYVSKK